MEALLEHLLFPLLLGHGMHDEPRKEQRLYGAGPDDDRPGRSRSDARLRAAVDRTHQISVVLGRVPGLPGERRPARLQ
ncbi:hypothetical protein [Actinomadura opuntiae]|uniref:hypothetical protein n=1 Tax=Actinomadura sp. OS1-43 TaxID=604315 RepID=UPI00255AA961|nr:hypothetical protein [Actinomadura sp. OS1-43]MDL4821083.1 hypothetical protein [Actinomadura sp. OS1-43]